MESDSELDLNLGDYMPTDNSRSRRWKKELQTNSVKIKQASSNQDLSKLSKRIILFVSLLFFLLFIFYIRKPTVKILFSQEYSLKNVFSNIYQRIIKIKGYSKIQTKEEIKKELSFINIIPDAESNHSNLQFHDSSLSASLHSTPITNEIHEEKDIAAIYQNKSIEYIISQVKDILYRLDTNFNLQADAIRMYDIGENLAGHLLILREKLSDLQKTILENSNCISSTMDIYRIPDHLTQENIEATCLDVLTNDFFPQINLIINQSRTEKSTDIPTCEVQSCVNIEADLENCLEESKRQQTLLDHQSDLYRLEMSRCSDSQTKIRDEYDSYIQNLSEKNEELVQEILQELEQKQHLLEEAANLACLSHEQVTSLNLADVKLGVKVVKSHTSETFFPTSYHSSTIRALTYSNCFSEDTASIFLSNLYDMLQIDIGVGRPIEAISDDMSTGSCWAMKVSIINLVVVYNKSHPFIFIGKDRLFNNSATIFYNS